MLVSNVFIPLKTGQKSSNLTTRFFFKWMAPPSTRLHFWVGTSLSNSLIGLWCTRFRSTLPFLGAEDRNDEQVQRSLFQIYTCFFFQALLPLDKKKHLPMSPCVFLGWKLFIAFNFQPILSFLLAPSLFPRASAAKSTADVFTLGDPPRSGPSLTPWKAGGEVARSVSGETPFYIGFAIMENAVWCAF